MYVVTKTIDGNKYFFRYTIDTKGDWEGRWEGLAENASKLTSVSLEVVLTKLRSEPDRQLITFSKV